MKTLVYDSVFVGAIEVISLSRHGGVSSGAFDSLNLANYVGDDASSVAQNISLAGQLVGTDQISVMQGEHGSQVHRVNSAGHAPVGDGLVSVTPGLALLALAADCVPFALVDPTANVMAVGHAGWRGVHGNVVQAVHREFVEAGADPIASVAVIGPSICGSCYEVPASRVNELKDVCPEAIVDDRHIDVSAGVKAQLTSLGIQFQQIPGCNLEDDRLFSYRRASGSPTGRGGLIVSLPSS